MSTLIVFRFAVLACLLSAPVLGCTTVPPADPVAQIADGQSFTMRPGDHVLLPDRSRLGYAGVRSDSRCPPDVQCIQAGNAVVDFIWLPAGGNAQGFQLATPEPPRSRSLGSRHVTLLSLAFGVAPQVQLQVERTE